MSGNYDSDELVDASPEDISAGETDGENSPAKEAAHRKHDDGVDTVVDDQNEGKDMFVDCPDELVSNDGNHGRVNVADNSEEMETYEPHQRSEEYNDIEKTNSTKSDNDKDAGDLTGDLEPLQAMLGKSVANKESSALEYEAERKSFLQGLANLHYQLNALSSQGSLINENDGGFINRYDSGTWEGEKYAFTDGQLQDMIYDCSQFVKHVLDERSQTQGTISELYSILHKKDQDIHELSARINESSVQQDTEAIADRVLNCLQSASNQGEILNESFTQKMFHIEKSTIHLIEKYNAFLSESNLLGQCITNVRSDHIVQDDVGSIFLTVREELLELRRKEVELTQKVTELEERNWKMSEELKRGSVIIDTANAEIQKIKAELEHEKARSNNTKEKLNLAVTKGKTVVQQRDSLKLSLAVKANELKRCFTEIQEKSSALEAAELCKQELIKCEILAASLQEELSERTTIIENCERVFFESQLPEELKSIDILGKVQWLANEKNKLMSKLQDVTIKTTEAANNEIERLTALILAESHEKHYLQEELENLRYRYDGMVEKEHQNSLEKDRTVRLLHEASEISMDGAEGLPSDLGFMIDRFLGKTKEKTSVSIGSSHVEREIFERMQSLLYTRDQEAMLFKKVLEEDILSRSQVNQLANKLEVVSQELHKLKEENESLQNTVSRSEEKSSLLREKLAMAVKKGKGLVQERENVKQLLDERREVARYVIDRLTALMLTEIQEKYYLKDELEDLLYKYEGALGREHYISLEKDRLVSMLHEASGVTMTDPEGQQYGMNNIIDLCFGRLREQIRVSIEVSQANHELFNRIQSFLYIRDQEAMLFENILEDDMLDRSQVNSLDNKVLFLSQELHDLRDEKDTLQTKLSHSEESTFKLREDLSLVLKEKTELVQEWGEMKQLLDKTRESARNEIDRLTLVIFTETQEKYYFEEVFETLSYDYAGIVEKEHQNSLEKDRVIKMLQEASGIALNDPEEMHADLDSIIEQCFQNLKPQAKFSVESFQVESDVTKRIQSLLYIRNFEAVLFESLLEVEMLNGSEVKQLEHKISGIYEELRNLKDEKDSLTNDLSHSEEKATLLRDKLSTAVKKGKGLVQERENVKQLLDEKNASIQNLTLELEQLEVTLNDYKNANHKLSIDADSVPKLEMDLNAIKEQRDHLEQSLAERNRMLRLIESIESIIFPDGSSVKEPAEKVQMLARYINECQSAKVQAQQELEIVKEESITRSDELALDENKIFMLIDEKEDVEVSRAAALTELHKKEEASCLSSELAEANKTIKSLEDSMSQVQTNMSFLAEENYMAQVGRNNLEREIEKLKEEFGLQARKLADASSSIKSYEEAIWKAENTISALSGDKEDAIREISVLKSRLNSCMEELGAKQKAEQEVADLKSQLNACMQELAGTRDTKEIGSPELYGHLNNLQLLLKDDLMLCLLKDSFQKKLDSLKDIDHILKDIRGYFIEMDVNTWQESPSSEEDSFALNQFADGLHSFENIEVFNGELDTADDDSFTLSIGKTVDNLQFKNKFIAEVFGSSSSFMDNMIASLLKKLVATRDGSLLTLEHMKSIKQHVNNMEISKQAQENAMEVLENNIEILLSACSGATLEMNFIDENNLLESDSVPETDDSSSNFFSAVRTISTDADAKHHTALVCRKYKTTANELLSGAKIVQKLIKQLQYMGTTVEDLQRNLKENSGAFDKVREERDFYQSRVSKLEADLEASEILCSNMNDKLKEHQAREGKWQEREEEIMSLYSISKKEKDTEDTLLSAPQLKSLFNKIDKIKIPAEFEVKELEPHDSKFVKKLFYIINWVGGLQHEIGSKSYNNELHETIIKNQAIETEHLKEQVLKHTIDKQDYEKMKHELFEVAEVLENIVQKLGGNEMVGTQRPDDVMGQLPLLEKLITAAIWESENSRSKAQELDTKLLRTQEVVDDLSSKVKFFEESNQGREASGNSIQEQGDYGAHALPTKSEISEIVDGGPLVNIPIPPAPSNGQVTFRKGSNDHLAVDIDSETDRLISKKDTAEEKGYVFKSLITSGLVPREGMTIADKIDGIWVAGDRALMVRPVARIGVIVYWLFLNLWLLGTIF